MKDCFYTCTLNGKNYIFREDDIEGLKAFIEKNNIVEASANFESRTASEKFTEAITKLGVVSSDDNGSEQALDELAQTLSNADKLTHQQKQDILQYLVSQFSVRGTSASVVNSSFTERLNKLEESIKSQYELIKNPSKEAQASYELFKEFLERVRNSQDKLMQEAFSTSKRESLVTGEEKDLNEDSEEDDWKDYSKMGIEDLPQDKLSVAIKRLLSGLESSETGFLGLPRTFNHKQLFDMLVVTMGKSTNPSTTVEGFIEMLKAHSSIPQINALLERLQKDGALEQYNKEIKGLISTTNLEAVTASFVVLGSKQDMNSLNFWEANANTPLRKLRNKWRNNHRKSEIIGRDGYYDKAKIQEYITEYEAISKILSAGKELTDETIEKISKFYAGLGINLSPITIKSISVTPFEYRTKGKRGVVTLTNLFSPVIDAKAYNNVGVQIYGFLKARLAATKEENYSLGANKDMFSHISAVKFLAEREHLHNPTNITLTRYSDKKIVTDYEKQNIFYQKINELKDSNSPLITKLRNSIFSRNSELLNLLENNREFAELFTHKVVDIAAIKKFGGEFAFDPKLENSYDKDYDVFMAAAFQNMRLPKLNLFIDRDGLPLRLTVLPTPTNSDKGRTFLMQTYAYAITHNTSKFFDTEALKEGNIVFSEVLSDLLYNNILGPEIDRIQNFKNENYTEGVVKASKRFNFIPLFNTLKINENETFLEAIHSGRELTEQEKSIVKDALENHFKEISVPSTINDPEFMGASDFSAGTYEQKTLLQSIAAIDREINTHIGYVNFFQTITADPAQFASNKDFKYDTEEGISRSLAINVGKRLGSVTASGETLANSDNEEYIEIILKDIEKPAINLGDIAEYYYGEEKLSEKVGAEYVGVKKDITYRELLQEYIDNPEDFDPIWKALLIKEFPTVKDFFNINTTDGQEYGTAEEGLRIALGTGRISVEEHNNILQKVKNQRASLAKGENIKAEDRLSSSEKKILFQPEKPVFAGHAINNLTGSNRYVYVKSSSLYLIPELTVGKSVDNLRLAMEALQDKHKVNVRAAFESAVKVGGVTNPIANLADPNLIPELLAYDREDSSAPMVVLPRKFFKKQQEVPNKSAKGVTEITLGTQMLKHLFGDEATTYTFEYEGQQISGRELRDEFFKVYKALVNLDSEKFSKRFGFDENFLPDNFEQMVENLSRELLHNAELNGFSEQEKTVFTIIQSFAQGKKHFQFETPLMFSQKPQKVEAFLMSLVQNALMRRKMRGFSFVMGSEEGFAFKSYKDADKSSFISVDGKLRDKLDINENGDYEIIIPAKFTTADGTLIDLYEGFDGTSGKYIHKNEKGAIVIKEDMIDPKLFEGFGYRIPTSSQSLGANVVVVGFYPVASGDTVFVPNTLLTLMGADFDVDKFNIYMYNNFVDEEGRIKVVTEENAETLSNALQSVKKERSELVQKTYEGFQDELNSLFDYIQKTTNLKRSDFKKEDGYYATDNLKAALGEALEHVLTSDEELDYGELYDKYDIGIISELEFSKALTEALQKFRQEKSAIIEAYKPILSKGFKKLKAANSKKLVEQNKFVAINRAVYGNKNVQQNATKALSIDYTSSQAETIDNILSESDGKDFDMLSTEYQKSRLFSGASGKSAIAIYAKAATFHSLSNQADIKPRFEGEGVTIGKLIMSPSFGTTQISLSTSEKDYKALGLPTKISSYIDERVQISVDNEKAQVLGRVGLTTGSSVAIDALLVLRGITASVENGKVYDIPFLISSNPTIKKIVDEVAESQAITTNMTPTLIQDRLTDEISYYVSKLSGTYTASELEDNSFYPSLTGENLTRTLQDPQYDTAADSYARLQMLYLYKQLLTESEQLRDYTASRDASKVGKSFAELLANVEELRNFPTKTEIKDYEGTFGKFIPKKEAIIAEEGMIDLENGFYFKAANPTAYSAVNSLMAAYKLFRTQNALLSHSMQNIIGIISSTSQYNYASRNRKIAFLNDIFTGMKEYLTSTNKVLSERAGDDITTARQEMLTGPDSLGSYLINILKHPDTPEWFKNNPLIQALEVEFNEDTKHDIIGYDSYIESTTSEDDLVRAFGELLSNLDILPLNRSGKQMTVRDFAQALIDYTFLTGGTTKGFKDLYRLIPKAYLNNYRKSGSKSIAEVLRDHSNKLEFANIDIDRFIEQFYRNNPEYVPSLKGYMVAVGNNEYYPRTKAKSKFPPLYLRTRDGIYRYNRSTGNYIYLSILGQEGFNEYNMDRDIPINFVRVDVTAPKAEITHNTLDGILQEFIQDSEDGDLKPLAEMFSSLNRILGLNVKLEASTSIPGAGRYENGVISYNINKIPDNRIKKAVIFAEAAHSVLSDNLAKVYNAKEDRLIIDETHPHYQEYKDIETVYRAFKGNIIDKIPATALKDPIVIKALTNQMGINVQSLVEASNNLHEFVSKLLGGNKDLINRLNELKSVDVNTKVKTSILDTFINALKNLFNKFLIENNIEVQKDSLLSSALTSTFNLIKIYDSNPGPAATTLTEPVVDTKTSVEEEQDKEVPTTAIEITPEETEIEETEQDTTMEEDLSESAPTVETLTEKRLTAEQERVGDFVRKFIDKPLNQDTDDPFHPDNVIMISGPGGTGKTFTITRVLKDLEREKQLRIEYSAPTHNAKRELQQSLKEAYLKYGVPLAKTYAAFFGISYSGLTGKSTLEPYDPKRSFSCYSTDVIVLDEYSMLGGDMLKLIKERLNHVKKVTGYMPKIILLGDYSQIPPVDATKEKTDYRDGEITNKIYHEQKQVVEGLFTNMRAKYQDIADISAELRGYIDRINAVAIYKNSNETLQDIADDFFLKFSSVKKSSTNVFTYNNSNKIDWMNNYLEAFRKGVKDNLKFGVIVNYNNTEHEYTQKMTQYIREQLHGEAAKNNIYVPGDLLLMNSLFVKVEGKNPKGSPVETSINKEERLLVKKVTHKNMTFKLKYWNKGVRKPEQLVITLPVTVLECKTDIGYTVYIPTLNDLGKLEDFYKVGAKRDITEIAKINGPRPLNKANEYRIISSALANLDYGYVVNSHKVQGSSYDEVFVDEDNINTAQNFKERVQLLYTAYSRAKHKTHIKASTARLINNEQSEAFDKNSFEAMPLEPSGFMDIQSFESLLNPENNNLNNFNVTC